MSRSSIDVLQELRDLLGLAEEEATRADYTTSLRYVLKAEGLIGEAKSRLLRDNEYKQGWTTTPDLRP